VAKLLNNDDQKGTQNALVSDTGSFSHLVSITNQLISHHTVDMLSPKIF